MIRELSNSLMIACVATGAAAGCRTERADKEQAKEEFREAWARPTPEGALEHPKTVVVARGVSPLVFQVQEPCRVHIVDTTTGAELASAEAGKLGLVYVSEEKGAFVSGKRVSAGPLPPGHAYAISVDVEQGESFKSEKKVLTAPKAPASQPGER